MQIWTCGFNDKKSVGMSIFSGEVGKNRILDGTRDGNNLSVRGEKSHSSHGLPAKVRNDKKKKKLVCPKQSLYAFAVRPPTMLQCVRSFFFLLKLSSLRFRFNTTVANLSVFFLRPRIYIHGDRMPSLG